MSNLKNYKKMKKKATKISLKKLTIARINLAISHKIYGGTSLPTDPSNAIMRRGANYHCR